MLGKIRSFLLYGNSFELKDNFDIDIYSQGFDRERGFRIYRHGNTEAFVYKLEKLDSLENEIRDFLDRPDFRLIRANDGSEKYLRFLYEGAKERFTVSQEYVDFYYQDNDRMNFFYTAEEQERFLSRLKIK